MVPVERIENELESELNKRNCSELEQELELTECNWPQSWFGLLGLFALVTTAVLSFHREYWDHLRMNLSWINIWATLFACHFINVWVKATTKDSLWLETAKKRTLRDTYWHNCLALFSLMYVFTVLVTRLSAKQGKTVTLQTSLGCIRKLTPNTEK